MEKNKVTFRKYTKHIFPYFNGNGAVFHTIDASCRNPKTAAIRHSFGNDECLNDFVRLGGIIEANRLMKEKPKYTKNDEYMFSIMSKDTINKDISLKELENDSKAKTFRINWAKSFGKKRRAAYTWTWLSNVMFSSFPTQEGQHSMVKIDYPTKQLVFKIHFPEMYPLKGNPHVIKINKAGKETKIADTVERDPIKNLMMANIKDKIVDRSFLSRINNPVLGYKYKVVWDIDLEKLTKYLGWMESRM